MKYYIIAGEPSGDIYGSRLIKEILQQNPKAKIRCWGGDLMKNSGGELLMHYKDLAFMGFLEVIKNIFKILKNLSFCKKDILKFKPDKLIFIDYPGFNLRIAKWAKRKSFNNYFYISPQIWAWRKGRLDIIKRVVDKMIVLFPFEEKIYQQAGIDVSWVGHPLLDEIGQESDSNEFRENCGLRKDLPLLAIAPGSRPSEMRKHLPTMLEALPKIEKKIGEFQCILPVADSIDFDEVRKKTQSSSVQLTVVPEQFMESVMICDAAVIASGTAVLQTGLAQKPFVIVYHVSPLTYIIARILADTKYIGMVNILADKEIVPELLQNKFTVSGIANQAVRLLQDNDYRGTMIGELKKIGKKLGEPGAYKRAALCIEDFIN